MEPMLWTNITMELPKAVLPLVQEHDKNNAKGRVAPSKKPDKPQHNIIRKPFPDKTPAAVSSPDKKWPNKMTFSGLKLNLEIISLDAMIPTQNNDSAADPYSGLFKYSEMYLAIQTLIPV